MVDGRNKIYYKCSDKVSFDIQRTVHRDIFFIIKANKMHSFSDLFDKVLCVFQSGPLSIIRSISTLYTHNKYLSC